MHRPPLDRSLVSPITGLRIHCRDWGGPDDRSRGGKPAVVLLHGLASISQIYDLVAPLIAGGHRVIAYDQRGHGDTEKPDHGYDPDTLLEDGCGLLAALEVPPPHIVVGHSWGASVALNWAVHRPESVHAALLIDGGVSSFRDRPGANWESVEARFAPPQWRDVRFEDLIARTGRGDLAFLDEGFRRTFFGALTEPKPDGTIRARLSRENHMRILRGMWEHDLDAAIAALQRPVLALLAVPRRPFSAQQEEMLAARQRAVARREAAQPLLRVEWLEDTIHDIPLQRPDAIAAAVERL